MFKLPSFIQHMLPCADAEIMDRLAMDFEISKLRPDDAYTIGVIVNLLNSSYHDDLSKYFIFRDNHYKVYLANLLLNPDEIIYIAKLPFTSDLIGFAQIKIQNSTVLLNNIIVRPEYRGRDVASSFLKFIAKESHQQNLTQIFALDVFEGNINVFEWYQRLGMQVVSTKYWYNLTDEHFIGSEYSIIDQNSISYQADHNGFVQVYLQKDPVATLINGNILLLRSKYQASDLAQLCEYFRDKVSGICLISETKENFPIIDKSFRLELPLSELLIAL